jgi:hypothetical protein
MIVHGCIEIHHKDCGGWIIVIWFRVLLISQHLFREILVEAVLGVHAGGVKIKKFLHLDVVTMHLLHKGFMEDYMCWYAHGKLFVHNERMVGSPSNASNVHGVVNDNSNPYRNMVMDAMRMNQGNVGQGPIVEEEPNTDATRFFDHLKDSDETL